MKVESDVVMKNMKKKKRKLNFQKLFCFASFIFILVCILWYGGRFVYFYLDTKKVTMNDNETKTFASTLIADNHNSDTFKQVETEYYFYGDASNNYVEYSNMLWRIIKVDDNDQIVLIHDDIVGTLAYGDKQEEYSNSNLINWLNASNDNEGIFEKVLNEKEKYLVKTSICTDMIDDIGNITCNSIYNEAYVGLLSIEDYVNTGGTKSFINSSQYQYLANKDKDDNIWYINNEGKLGSSDGEDIYGIKPVITLSEELVISEGNGSKENPYKFEESIGLIGSYVKLDDDIWRIYEEKDGIVKLISQNFIQDEENKFKYSYSKKTYYHNDTVYGSLAYYLNHDFLNSLSYKDIIVENTYVNGYYGSDVDYLYREMLDVTIDTKVSIPSIHDVIFNDDLDGYFTNTGINEASSFVYTRNAIGTISSKNVMLQAGVVPCISIEKDNLKVGSGDIDDPFRME